MLLVVRDHNNGERSHKAVECNEFVGFYQETRLEDLVSLTNIMCGLSRS
jgi:hypothetical protein